MSLGPTADSIHRAFRDRPWLMLLGIYLFMTAFHGIAIIDLIDFRKMAVDMSQVLVTPDRQFLYSSPINYMIGDLFGPPTLFSYYAIHISEMVLMLAVIAVCVNHKLPNHDEQIRFYAFLSLTPIWLITLKWIGKPDPVLISMMFLCWAFPGRWRYLCALVMVMMHREMGIFMCGFLFIAENKEDYGLIIPVLLGCLFHFAYEHYGLDHLPTSRVSDVTINIWMHPREVMEHPVVYGFGTLSWYWLVMLWQRPSLRPLIGYVGALGVAVICEDFTRDFILMALAPLVFHLEKIVKTPSSNVLMRFFPLFFLQIQVAAMGNVFKLNNVWVDWLTGQLHDQLSR